MTHPLTPPPELVREWNKEATGTHFEPYGYSEFIATRAAQWGWDQREPEIQAAADAELEARVQTLKDLGWHNTAADLRAARRPKPPSLKQEGFAALELLKHRTTDPNIIEPLSRALEALSDD